MVRTSCNTRIHCCVSHSVQDKNTRYKPARQYCVQTSVSVLQETCCMPGKAAAYRTTDHGSTVGASNRALTLQYRYCTTILGVLPLVAGKLSSYATCALAVSGVMQNTYLIHVLVGSHAPCEIQMRVVLILFRKYDCLPGQGRLQQQNIAWWCQHVLIPCTHHNFIMFSEQTAPVHHPENT